MWDAMDACVQLTSVFIVLQNQTESWRIKSLEFEIKHPRTGKLQISGILWRREMKRKKT